MERIKAALGRVSWQRNLVVLWIAEVLSIAGFSVVLPFLPYYVQELGITESNQVIFWSGLLTSAQAVTMALIAPVWGSLADRYGRKIMVVRAMFGGAVVMSMMGFVQNVYQLIVLRAIQGLLTGTVPAAMTLVASSTPSQRRGFALGIIQMAIYLGSTAGPFLGGFVADQFGYRPTFWITGALLFLAGVVTSILVREDFTPIDGPVSGQKRVSLWQGIVMVFSSHALLILFGIRVLERMAIQVISPVMALFIQSIAPSDTKIATLTGTITGFASAASAVSAVFLGRLSDRVGARRVVIACSAVSALCFAMQSQAQTPVVLLIWRTLAGVSIGGIVASVSALQAALVPKDRYGAVYGVDTSLVAGANAVAPMIGAALTTSWGLPAAFWGAAVLYAVVAMLVFAIVPRTQTRA
ncbi:MAG: MFS transporter [Anaerolineae bacterium]|nr:MFS transporter [Anaerolineae bacterium]